MDVVQRLSHLRDVVTVSGRGTKYLVRDGQLHVDHSSAVGRCLRSWAYPGYSRVTVCDHLATLLRECMLCIDSIVSTARAPYIFENFRVHAIVSDRLSSSIELAGHLIDTAPSFTKLTDILCSTYEGEERVDRVIRDLHALTHTIDVEVQSFYMRYISHDVTNALVPDRCL